MTSLAIILDGAGALKGERVVVGEFTRVLTLDSGMASGKPSVGVVVELPDGSVVLGQTSLGLFLAAADAFKARHGDPRLDETTAGGKQ